MTQPKELSGRIGKYEILRVLGRGAMGIVYVAHDTVLERDVALKLMASSIADEPSTIDRFTREAKAVAKMTHPNVVTVFDLGSHTDGSPFIAMELLKGQDLQRTLRTPPSPTLERKLSVLVQVLAGLDHAHQAGIVHRDIKPANIFLCTDGTVKIMDFGVARLATASMTGTGKIVGTADYMSPEQVKGAKVDGRSDLFSVGCMLYELLVGRRPFHSDNLMAIFYKITHEEPDYELLPKGDAADLLPILRKSMAKDLAERYQTARELAADLREYLRSHAGSTSAARVLENVLEGGPSADVLVGATVVEADPMPSTYRAAPTAPAPSGAQPTLLEARGAPTVTPAGATEIIARPAPPARRPATIPPPRPVPPPSGSKGLLIGGGVAVAAVVLAVGAWLLTRPSTTPEGPAPTLAAGPSAPASIASGPPETAAAAPATSPPTVPAHAEGPRPATVESSRPVPPPVTSGAPATTPPVLTAPPATAPPVTQPSRAAQVGALLNQADNALLASNYDAAIAAYDEALKLDPQSPAARQGRSTAIQARTLAAAASAAPAVGKAFVSGRTKAASAETRAADAGASGFEGGAEVVVKAASQAAQLPGKIVFDIDPERVKPGDPYKVRIFLLNEGSAPIEIQSMVIATSINGKSVRGAVPPLSKEIAPRQRALLRELPDTWKEATTSWSMEVTVRTPRSETYTNQVTWQ